jgi:hypothetical protein
VVKDARLALQAGDPDVVLKWVEEDAEPEVRAAFAQTLVVRALSREAEALADRYFFETLVRLHRQGEGAGYTGLKPAGVPVDPAVAAADRALETGSAAEVGRLLVTEVDSGLRHRFELAVAARRQAGVSRALGRAYVAAYVEFVHYVERLHEDATSAAAHDEGTHRPAEH